MTWQEAVDACASISGRLVHPENMNFVNLVSYLSRKGKMVPK